MKLINLKTIQVEGYQLDNGQPLVLNYREEYISLLKSVKTNYQVMKTILGIISNLKNEGSLIKLTDEQHQILSQVLLQKQDWPFMDQSIVDLIENVLNAEEITAQDSSIESKDSSNLKLVSNEN